MVYQEIFRPVFEDLNFMPTKTFRDGPRFFVVGGEYQGKKAIFKADVEDPKSETRRAYLKLRREAAFLECGPAEHVPAFYAQGERKDFFWMLEGMVPGESQEMGDSTFLFKDSFFNEKNLTDCLDFLAFLHGLPKSHKNPKFEEFKDKFAKRYTLKDYAGLIASDKEDLVGVDMMGQVDWFIGARYPLFDSNQSVIAHHEFYAPHIFVNGGKLSVIDWENVGWGNPAYDFTELWFRSFAHPDFQKELLDRFRTVQPDKEVFDQLFSVEIILQGLGNLKHFSIASLAEERQAAAQISDFIKENLERTLTQNGKL